MNEDKRGIVLGVTSVSVVWSVALIIALVGWLPALIIAVLGIFIIPGLAETTKKK